MKWTIKRGGKELDVVLSEEKATTAIRNTGESKIPGITTALYTELDILLGNIARSNNKKITEIFETTDLSVFGIGSGAMAKWIRYRGREMGYEIIYDDGLVVKAERKHPRNS